MNKLSIGIKTFCRPKALDFCLNNFAFLEKYLGIQIIIADDSNDKYKKENLNIINSIKNKNKKINIKYLDLSFDTGLSYGRNKIVENCETKYIMILDDSRTFDKNARIYDMVNFLEETDYDLIAGKIINHSDLNYVGIFENITKNKNNGKIYIKINKNNSNKYNIINNYFENVYKTNIALNIFIATKESLLKTKWNDNLKLGEHEFFFYNYYKNNYKCAMTTDINFIQVSDNLRLYPNNFSKFRKRADNLWKKYIKIIWYRR